MTLWRLEWLRVLRTRRWLALVGTFVFFGFLGPLTAAYLPEIISMAGGDLEGATITLPPATAADGIGQFASNALQIGTLVAAVVAAGATTLDAIPEMGVFLRTRVANLRVALVPRIVVTAVVVVVAWLLGVGTAWYETWALLGAPATSAMLWGSVLGAAYLVFVVTLVAAVASRARTVLATVIASVLILLVMPLFGISDAIGRWLPSHLAGALPALASGSTVAGDYVAATAVTMVATVGLAVLSFRLAGRLTA